MYLKKNHPLRELNTFHIECRAKQFAAFGSKEELLAILNGPAATDRIYILGGGSNTLFTGTFDGTVLHPSEERIDIVSRRGDKVLVKASAGTVWDDFVRFCIGNGLWGAENLSYIPGSVGASPVQNIGAYSAEAKDIISSVEIYDIQNKRFEELPAAICGFGYRDSIFKHALRERAVVVSVTYALSTTPRPNLHYRQIDEAVREQGEPTLENIREAVIAIRKNKLPDPDVIGNGGSFFKNPIVEAERADELVRKYPDIPVYPAPEGKKISAAWLIEQAGWKGFREGDAGVHDRQALVLVNHGKATGNEIVTLAGRIIGDVREKFGIALQPEINII